jgi:hypothetical protein
MNTEKIQIEMPVGEWLHVLDLAEFGLEFVSPNEQAFVSRLREEILEEGNQELLPESQQESQIV